MGSTRSRQPGVYLVHRIGAAMFGLALWVFAGLGFASALEFFSTRGEPVLGLSTNGALSTISAIAGAVLIAGAWSGASVASTVTVVMGTVFLLSGLAHLALISTPWNLLAFRLPNVFFSLVAGMGLLLLGVYGRVSGGLPPDNPYRRAHPRRRTRPTPREQDDVTVVDAHQQEMLEAEMAMGEGHPTPRQAALVEEELAEQRTRERARAWRTADQRTTPPDHSEK